MASPSVPARVAWGVELLDVRPSDHLLEIGCGAGVAVSLVCERLTRGTITAIDRSGAMVARARARNAAHVAAGVADIRQASLADIALGRRFRKVLAINVNALWKAPAPNVASLVRLLHPAGTVHLVYEPPSAARLRELERRLRDALAGHGLHVGEVLTRALGSGAGLCVLAAPRAR
jgi:protein-L-isoaspartate O-methyltransferase